ncbi:MAG: PqiC family protein [Desulfobulbaceae bacterium]|nr:PqiC family protein [Desulfobulbaceae bacterium]HIJ90648.1 membrane integrity-associated transporter subunit PqiC [Deltaproteobacteria bacterium]
MKNNRGERMNGLLLLLMACGLFLAGCARTAPISYYQLSPLEVPGKSQLLAEADKLVIGIGPVRLPEYLDRLRLVTRLSPTRLQLADSHRWAEPLSENIPRVLGENLSLLLGTDRILLYPWPSARITDYQLLVEVLHFENQSDGTARLVVRWWVKGKDGGIVLPERRSSYLIPVTVEGREAMVGALNETLGSFCREIVRELTPVLVKPSRSGL